MADLIHVAIRVRPLNDREKNTNQYYAWTKQGDNTLLFCQREGKPAVPTAAYTFDKIFSDTDTASVYDSLGRDIILSTMDGVNGTIFAYGQTSSGKTHTMQGTAREPGIIPLAINDIFQRIMATPDREYLLRVSYLEIYNEVIKDLLNPEKGDNLKIHENPNREIFVGNLSESIVLSPDDVRQLMLKGESNRHVGETNMNEHSSRSHTIFRMIVESRERSKSTGGGEKRPSYAGAVKVSSLNLVDLAGSERVGHTGAEGIRLKEGGHINKSLLTLGTVIAKLSDTDDHVHIPYRDSKLTRILQPSLGGNARTAIICTVTPASGHIEETSSTLKFASRAKTICNKPEINEVLSDEALLKRYRREISELKKQLDQVVRERGNAAKGEGDGDGMDGGRVLLEKVEEAQYKCQLAEKDSEVMLQKLREKELEQTRLAENYQKLKRTILTSSHLGRDGEGPVTKKARMRRRQTWFPGVQPSTGISDDDDEKPDFNPSIPGYHHKPPFASTADLAQVVAPPAPPSTPMAHRDGAELSAMHEEIMENQDNLMNMVPAVVVPHNITLDGSEIQRLNGKLEEMIAERNDYIQTLSVLTAERMQFAATIEEIVRANNSNDQHQDEPDELKELRNYIEDLSAKVEDARTMSELAVSRYASEAEFLHLEATSARAAYDDIAMQSRTTAQRLEEMATAQTTEMDALKSELERTRKRAEEAEQALLQTREETQMLAERLSNSEGSRMRGLEEARTVAEEATKLESKVFKSRVDELMAEKEQLIHCHNEVVDALKRKMQEATDANEAQIVEFQNVIADLKIEHEAARMASVKTDGAEMESLGRQIAEMETLRLQIAEMETANESNSRETRATIENLETSKSELSVALDRALQQAGDSESLLADAKSNSVRTDEEMSALRSQIVTLEATLEQKSAKEDPSMQEQIQKLEMDLQATEQKSKIAIEDAISKEEIVQNLVRDLEDARKSINDLIAEKEAGDNQLQQQVDQLKIELVESHDIGENMRTVQEALEGQIANLKGELEEAKKLLDGKNNEEQDHDHDQMDSLKAELEATRQEIATIATKWEQAQDTIHALTEGTNGIQKALDDRTEQSCQMSKELDGIKEELLRSQEIVMSKDRQLEENGDKISALQQELDRANAISEEIGVAVRTKQVEIDDLRKDHADVQSRLEDREAHQQEEERKIEILRQQLLEAENSSLEQTKKFDATCLQFREELEHVKELSVNRLTELEAKKAEMEVLKHELTESKSNIDQIIQEKDVARIEIQSLAEKVARLENENAGSRDEFQKQAMDELEVLAKQLEAERTDASNNAAQLNSVIQKLKEEHAEVKAQLLKAATDAEQLAEKYEKSELLLLELAEQRTMNENIRAALEITKEKLALAESEKSEAVEALVKECERMREQLDEASSNMEKYRTASEEASVHLDRTLLELAELQKEKEDLRRTSESIGEEHASITAEQTAAFGKLEEELERTKQQLANALESCQGLTDDSGKMESMVAELEEQRSLNDELRSAYDEIKKKLGAAKSEQASLMADTAAEVRMLREVLETTEKACTRDEDTLRKVRARLAEVEAEKESLRSQYSQFQTNKDLLSQKIDELQAERSSILSDLKIAEQQASEKLATLEVTVQELQTQALSAEERAHKAEEKCLELEEQQSSFEEQILSGALLEERLEKLQHEKQHAVECLERMRCDLVSAEDNASHSETNVEAIRKRMEEMQADFAAQSATLNENLAAKDCQLQLLRARLDLLRDGESEALSEAEARSAEAMKQVEIVKDQLEERIANVRNEYEAAMEKAKEETLEEKRKMEESWKQATSRLEDEKMTIFSQLTETLDKLNVKEEEVSTLQNRLETEIANLVERIDRESAQMRQESDAKDATIRDLNDRIEALDQDIGAKNQQLLELSVELKAVSQKLQEADDIQDKMLLLKASYESMEGQFISLKSEHQETIDGSICLRDAKEKAMDELNRLRDTMQQREQAIEVLKEESRKWESKWTENDADMRKELDAVQHLYATSENQIASMRVELQHLQHSEVRLKEIEKHAKLLLQENNELRTDGAVQAKRLKDVITEMDVMSEQNGVFKQNVADLQKQLAEYEEAYNISRIDLQNVTNHGKHLEKERDESRRQGQELEAKAHSLEQNLQEHVEKCTDLSSRLEESYSIAEDLQNQLDHAVQVHGELQEIMAKGRSQFSAQQSELEEVTAELEEARGNIDESTKHIHDLEKALTTQQNDLKRRVYDFEEQLALAEEQKLNEIVEAKEEMEHRIADHGKEVDRMKALLREAKDEIEQRRLAAEQIAARVREGDEKLSPEDITKWEREVEVERDATARREKALRAELDKTKSAYAQEQRLHHKHMEEYDSRSTDLARAAVEDKNNLAELQLLLHQREGELDLLTKKIERLETQQSEGGRAAIMDLVEQDGDKDADDSNEVLVRNTLKAEVDKLRSDMEALRKENRTAVLVRNNEIMKSRQLNGALATSQSENEKLRKENERLRNLAPCDPSTSSSLLDPVLVEAQPSLNVDRDGTTTTRRKHERTTRRDGNKENVDKTDVSGVASTAANVKTGLSSEGVAGITAPTRRPRMARRQRADDAKEEQVAECKQQ